MRWRPMLSLSLGFLGMLLVARWYAMRNIEAPAYEPPAPVLVAHPAVEPPVALARTPTTEPAATPPSRPAIAPSTGLPPPRELAAHPVEPSKVSEPPRLGNTPFHTAAEIEAHVDQLADAGTKHLPDRDGIRDALHEKLPEIRECYEEWHKQNPALRGQMKLNFVIESVMERDVAVVKDVSTDGLKHEMFEGCIRNVISELRFDPPPGGTLKVGYPFRFENTAFDAGGTP